MSIPARAHNFGTYFVTAACAERRRIFQVDRNAKLLEETILHYREHYLLHSYVVMPDHFHLIFAPQNIPLERAMQYIKGRVSHRYNAEKKIKDANLAAWLHGSSNSRCE